MSRKKQFKSMICMFMTFIMVFTSVDSGIVGMKTVFAESAKEDSSVAKNENKATENSKKDDAVLKVENKTTIDKKETVDGQKGKSSSENTEKDENIDKTLVNEQKKETTNGEAEVKNTDNKESNSGTDNTKKDVESCNINFDVRGLQDGIEVTESQKSFMARGVDASGELLETTVSFNDEVLKPNGGPVVYGVKLKPGKNIIKVEVKDKSGNEEKKEYTITYKPKEIKETEKPVIKVEGLQDKQEVTKKELSFKITVTDNVEKDIKTVVKLNEEVIIGTNGEYKVTLKDGENTITIEATDAAGNKSDKTYKIIYIKESVVNPTIKSITPVDNVEVRHSTTKDDAIKQIVKTTTIKDSNDKEHTVNLIWTIENYDGNKAGEYTAIGTFTLPEGVDQAAEVIELKVTAKVKVKEEDTAKSVKEQLNKNLAFIFKNVDNPTLGTGAGEWSVLCLARGNYTVPKGYYNKYYSNVVKVVQDSKGVLHKVKYTEHSRLILGLTSIGKDVTDVGGYNQLEKLADYKKVIRQGINGPIFALIALDTKGYEIPKVEGVEVQTTRDMLVQYILDKEINKGTENAGGWALCGDIPDPDITAMAIQGLTPYYKTNADVKVAVDRAVLWLSNAQKDDGGYSSWGSINSESIAQVVVALTGIGIDPHTDPGFVKKGNSAIDALLSFAVPEGGFMHVKPGGTTNGGAEAGVVDGMATDQGTYALIAYDRFINNKNRLYDMTDVNVKPEEPKDTEKPVIKVEGLQDGEEVTTPMVKFKVTVTDNIDKDIKPIVCNNDYEISEKNGIYRANLSNGDNEITIKAVDKAGNETKITYKLKLISPEIDVRGLEDEEVVDAPKLKFKAKSYDWAIYEDITCIVKVNEKQINGDKEGNFEAILDPGENVIYIEASDSKGKTSTIKYKVIYNKKEITSIRIKEVKKTELKLGETVDIEVVDQDGCVIKPGRLEYKIDNKDSAKMMDSKFVPLKDGNINLKIELFDNPNLNETLSFKIHENSRTVYIRIEGYDNTILPRTKVKVPLYDISGNMGPSTGSSATPSKGWGMDKFKDPTNAHGLVYALTELCGMHQLGKIGTNRESDGKDNFDFQDYGWSLYISMIGGDREFDQGPMSGWMYSVNGVLPPVGCNGKPLEDGDDILWFYGAYGFDTMPTTMVVDKTAAKPGEEILLDLTGVKTSGAGGAGKVDEYGREEVKIKNATIIVNEKEFQIDGKDVKTDENGKATMKFDKPGEYVVTAERYKMKRKKPDKKDIVKPNPIKIIISENGQTDPEIKDTEAPKIEVTGINDEQEVTTKEVSFKVTVTDNVDEDIKPVVKLNNEVIEETNGEYKVTLKDGENKITIEATDAAGNKASQDYKIVLKKEFITDSTFKPNIRIKGFYDGDKVDKAEIKFDITFKHITEEPTVKLNNEVISGKVLEHDEDIYKVEYVVGLNEGKNILNVNAVNMNATKDRNKKATKEYVIKKVKDATPPVIETDLKNNIKVEDKEFIFHVKAVDNIDGEVEVKVTLNGDEIEGVNGEYKVILEYLSNNIKIEAIDSSGNIANDNDYFIITRKDKEPPTIETNLEDEQKVVNDEIILNVNADDNSGYVETTVKLNGEELSESEKGYNLKLKDGENLIYIEAVDKEGNKTTKQYRIIKVDKSQDIEAPNLEVEGIKDGQKLKTSKLNFKVKVTDNLDVNVKEVVKLNGEIVTGTNGEYKLILNNGQNTINISATDISGNKIDKAYKVIYDISFIKEIKIVNKFDNVVTGNQIELEVLDQDNENVDMDELTFSVDNEEKGKIINNKGSFQFKALSAGNISLTAALKNNLSVKTPTINFNIGLNKKKVYMRIEGYDHTILPRTEMEVPLYNLSKDLGKADGSSASDSSGWGPEKFSEPTNAHAIVYALKNYCNMHSQDRANKEKDGKDNFNLQDYGWSLYIAMIGGDREFGHGQMSGWMYRVNDELLPVGCQGADLRDGDEILWYYGAFGFENIYTKLESNKSKMKPGEQVKLHAKGYKGGYVNEEIDLEDATILINGEEYKENGKVVKTDEKGNATIKLNDIGKYEISLVRFRPGNGMVEGTQQIDIVRPIPIIIDVSTNTKPEYPEEKDTESPKIEVTGITDGEEIAAKEVSFKVTITDNVDKNIKPLVKLNGEVIIGTNGDYKVTLNDGENVITVEAIDAAGNKSNKIYKLIYKSNVADPEVPEEKDTEAPKIEVTGITDGEEVSAKEVIFKITITDNVDKDIKPLVKLNGKVITGTNGDYKVTLNDRENEITVEAIDASGNKSNKTYKLVYKKGELTLEEKVNESIEKVHNYVLQNGTWSSDWKTVAFNKSGLQLPESYNSDYLNKTEKVIKDSNGYFYKVTDYERITLGVVAAGGDPRNIGGYNLLDKIYNFHDEKNPNRKLDFQGLNGIIYGLIALDTKKYKVPTDAKYTREYMLDYVLENRNSDGGWDLNMNGSNSDVDITSMTLIALAPYQDYVSKSGKSVKDAVNEASNWLSKVQRKDGGYNSWFTENNSESCAQTIIGLSVNGIDPTSAKFTKDRNLVENLLRFQQSNGEFYHLMDGSEGVNGMSTEQAYQALLAYRDFVNSGRIYNKGKNSIYYFGESNNGDSGDDTNPDENKDTEAPKIEITGLKDGQEVKDTELIFKVTIRDNVDKDIKPIVKLNEEVVTGTNGEYKVELKDGENIISIEAIDKAGNKSEISYKINKVDGEKPVIEVTGLTDGQEVEKSELIFKVAAKNNSGEDIVPVVKLNGEIIVETNGEYKVKLKDGENKITIEAIDELGRKSEISYKISKVIKDTEAPKIEVTGLTDNVEVTTKELSFKVDVTDNVDKDIVPVVKLNGEIITGTNGEYKVQLKDGDNTISIEAVDKAGNKVSQSYAIRHKVVEIKAPEEIIMEKGIKNEVKVDIKNISEKDKEITLSVVLYDKNTNEMIDYKFVKKLVKIGENGELKGQIEVPQEGEYLVKVIFCDDLSPEKMNVLTDPIFIEVK